MKQSTRRILACCLALAMMLCLTACGSQTASTPATAAPATAAPAPAAPAAPAEATEPAPASVEWPEFLTVGGGSTGGVFFSAAAGIAQLLTTQGDTTATAQTTTGGGQNIQLISNGEMELGIAAADVCAQAYNGIGAYADKKLDGIAIICAIYPSYYQQVIRTDSKVKSFDDFAGSTMVVGGAGSGTETSARAVFAAHGYDYLDRSDLTAEYLGISEGVEKIQNKQADGMNSITPFPFASFVELTMTDTARLISLKDEAIDKLVNADGSVFLKGVIPAGSYANQEEDVNTIYMQTFLICDKNLDEDLVYEITKLMVENTDYLCTQHTCFEAMNDESVVAGASIPFHPGALRYYTENGMIS